MTDYGLDVGHATDLDPFFEPVTGPRAVVLAVARRYVTPRGALAYDPDFGLDVRDYLSAPLDAADTRLLARQLTDEAEKDERVLTADISLVRDGDALLLSVALTLAEGTFRFVLTVDRLDVVLREE